MAAALALASAAAAQSARPSGSVPGATLREAAQKRGLLVGTCAASAFFREDQYAAVLARELSQVEPENDMKFGPIHPRRDGYAWERADALVDFGLQHGMRVRGHTLTWHSQNPAWLTEGKFSSAELSGILHDHISTVVGRYAGKVAAWDVVNEAFNDDGTMRSTIWYDKPGLGRAGTGYIEQALLWARAADPKAVLFYNDYGTENVNRKSDAIYAMVKDFRARGVPLDGVGFQFHIKDNDDLGGMDANFKRFAGLGVKIEITELDVRLPLDANGEPSAAGLAKQAQVYQSIFATCLKYRACTAIQMWGFTDRHSWVPQFFKGTGAALPFDRDYRPKPAYQAIMEELQR
jgi:endo-1,4-beta-xylanase